ncbi:MAG: double-strand break repair helicase AddA [Micavibrio sp.]
MTQNPAQFRPDVPDPDPNIQQGRAADPGQSVWVAASAGSGKTKVLTDRVLRLLLPVSPAQPGTPAERILCLTFTKAGAAEMAVRITKKLAEWAVQDEAGLHENLGKLLSRAPRPDEMEAARRLFAQVIDSPGGLKILTLHSFCQSVLGRFPLEAGLSPHATVADENAIRPMQQNALEAVLRNAEKDPEGPLHRALQQLTAEKGEGDLLTLLQCLISERTQLSALLRYFGDDEAVHARLCRILGIDPADSPEKLLQVGLARMDEPALRVACAAMASAKTASMQKAAQSIQAMLDAANRVPLYPAYKAAFLTQDGTILARLTTKEIAPEIAVIMHDEAERLCALEDRLKAVHCAAQTRNLLHLGTAMLGEYAAEKSRNGVLDYDDLIFHTLRLLTGKSMGISPESAAQWVMYKLDQGIDHILVDEAQDTNPEQWEIIHALCSEFFAGSGARPDLNRTIFAVGDEKQSIFGFQRAAPEKFRQAEAHYKAKVTAARQKFDSVPMNISFRSTASVLALTDAVFDNDAPWQLLGLPDGTVVEHVSNREGQAGRVEIWPLIRTDPAPDPAPWVLPVTIEDTVNAEAQLCDRIAGTIREWIKQKDILEAYGRPVEPGDILILVRSRGSIVERLVRALKSAGLPVSGIDRMVLSEQIAVQDLLAAARFALLPEDDLSLAALLKSPLLGIDEETLFAAAIDRNGKSLWQTVKERLDPAITDWLTGLMAKGGSVRPYEFFSDLLHLPCPADPDGSGLRAMIRRLGDDCLDPLEEFLNTALLYEAENIPSLQPFLNWQDEGDTTIKRELESAGGKIRIMTVHAAKGLQAPIVILPDTAHTANSIGKIGTGERLLWMVQTDGPPIPIWSARSEADCSLYTAVLNERKIRLTEEYRRLFYVALTRAADRLYIAGCVKNRDPSDESWYALAEEGFKRLEKNRPTGFTLEPLIDGQADTPGYRLGNPQTAAPDRVKKDDREKAPILPACTDWSWLTRAPPEEENPPRPWSPSRPADPEPATRSPLDGAEDLYRFRRGVVTHTLLQFLPGLPQAQWQNAAEMYAGKQDLSAAVKTGIVQETLAVLTHPDFGSVFGPGSMAEVPITGLIDGKLVSGQIDRLLVTTDEIRIVDYKTNRPPPHEKDVPALYRAQLRAYRDTLAKIYPARRIRCFLLWTDGPVMMEIIL